MFGHLLIAVDGRSGGREAAALGQALAAGWPGAHLTYARLRTDPMGVGDAEPDDPRDRPAELLAQARRCGLPADYVSAAGSDTTGGLRMMLDQSGADLLVLGSSHRGPLGRVLLGGSAATLVEGTSVAVAVAPAGYRPRPVSFVGVAHDGSPAAAEAFLTARELRDLSGARLMCVSLISPRRSPAMRVPDPGASVDERAAAVFSAEEWRLIQSERIETFTGLSSPGPGLAALSDEVDLLVLGAPRHPLGRVLVAEQAVAYLLTHARCPLLIVPAGRPSTATAAGHGRAERPLRPAVPIQGDAPT